MWRQPFVREEPPHHAYTAPLDGDRRRDDNPLVQFRISNESLRPSPQDLRVLARSFQAPRQPGTTPVDPVVLLALHQPGQVAFPGAADPRWRRGAGRGGAVLLCRPPG